MAQGQGSTGISKPSPIPILYVQRDKEKRHFVWSLNHKPTWQATSFCRKKAKLASILDRALEMHVGHQTTLFEKERRLKRAALRVKITLWSANFIKTGQAKTCKIRVSLNFQSWTRLRIWGFAEATAHPCQVFPGFTYERNGFREVEGNSDPMIWSTM